MVIYRESDTFCGYLQYIDDFKEDDKKVQQDTVYIFPLKSLRNMKLDPPLDKIHDRYLNLLGWQDNSQKGILILIHLTS